MDKINIEVINKTPGIIVANGSFGAKLIDPGTIGEITDATEDDAQMLRDWLGEDVVLVNGLTVSGAAEGGVLREAQTRADDAEKRLEEMSPSAEDRMSRIVGVVKLLNPENKDHYTKGGKARIEVIEALTGLADITSEERDAAQDAVGA